MNDLEIFLLAIGAGPAKINRENDPYRDGSEFFCVLLVHLFTSFQGKDGSTASGGILLLFISTPPNCILALKGRGGLWNRDKAGETAALPIMIMDFLKFSRISLRDDLILWSRLPFLRRCQALCSLEFAEINR